MSVFIGLYEYTTILWILKAIMALCITNFE